MIKNIKPFFLNYIILYMFYFITSMFKNLYFTLEEFWRVEKSLSASLARLSLNYWQENKR